MNTKKKTTEDKLVKSINKNVRSSTRKLKPILKSIVGKKVDTALKNLSFSDKRISKDVKKTISSAIANAEHNQGLDVDSLFVSTIAVDESFTMKRIRARARGRADRFFKRSCNISLTLEEKGK